MAKHLKLNNKEVPIKEDLSGQRFGRLVVISYDASICKWTCICDCGKRSESKANHLKSGATKSCGCLFKELVKIRSYRHGLSKSAEYVAWFSMCARCYKPNFKYYHHYGGRGITVCDRWKNSFLNFYEDMGGRPTPKHSLDRIDNDKDYSKENCRWATKVEQANNMSKNVYLEYDGLKMTMAQWSRHLKIPLPTIFCRVKKGYAVSDILANKSFRNDLFYTHLGETLSRLQWIDRLCISQTTFDRHIKKRPFEDIVQTHLKEEYRNLIF